MTKRWEETLGLGKLESCANKNNEHITALWGVSNIILATVRL